MRYPFVKQAESMDCGPTCLAMVCKFHKKNVPTQFLKDKAQIGKEGVNLLGISEAAESIGFRTQSVKISYSTLIKDAPLPAILHWDQKHFVVLYNVKNDRILVADPARGLIKYSEEDFKRNWVVDTPEEEGIALLLQPGAAFNNDSIEQEPGRRNLGFSSIYQYITPYKKLIIQLFLGLIVGSLIQLVLPFLTQSIVDVGINKANINFIYLILFAQMALYVGRMTVEIVRSWILLHISTRINISILTDFLIKLMKLPLGFFDSKKTGDILQRMSDHHRIESFLTGSSINVIFSLFNLVIYSTVLLFFSPKIFLIFLLSSVLYSGWAILFLKKRSVLDNKRFETSSRQQASTIQLVQGMQEIKLNGIEKSMRWNWERLQTTLFNIRIKTLALNQWQQSGALFINESKNIFISFLSAMAVIDGQLTLGGMIAVQYMIGQLNSPIEQMIGFLQNWQNAKISLGRLNEIHSIEDEEPANKEFRQAIPLAFQRNLTGGQHFSVSGEAAIVDRSLGGIAYIPDAVFREPREEESVDFHNVSFTYSGAGNEPVLKNINLSIPVSKVTAIVGASGSGKSTLLKILLKYYQCQQGDIKVGKTSLSNISHRAWRSHCAAVMQESYIFSDTIARNIAVGNEKIDMDALNQAVELANIADFIERLPLGLNTKIGTEGTGISMGQKQRILIARAIYRNPDFMFLDEATNSLDANNESVILEKLESFFRGRTVVVVAHRLSTVKNADQIVVLDNGVITERGTHQELISLKGAYFKLVKNQLELGE